MSRLGSGGFLVVSGVPAPWAFPALEWGACWGGPWVRPRGGVRVSPAGVQWVPPRLPHPRGGVPVSPRGPTPLPAGSSGRSGTAGAALCVCPGNAFFRPPPRPKTPRNTPKHHPQPAPPPDPTPSISGIVSPARKQVREGGGGGPLGHPQTPPQPPLKRPQSSPSPPPGSPPEFPRVSRTPEGFPGGVRPGPLAPPRSEWAPLCCTGAAWSEAPPPPHPRPLPKTAPAGGRRNPPNP